jgi:hypothetical protein
MLLPKSDAFCLGVEMLLVISDPRRSGIVSSPGRHSLTHRTPTVRTLRPTQIMALIVFVHLLLECNVAVPVLSSMLQM